MHITESTCVRVRICFNNITRQDKTLKLNNRGSNYVYRDNILDIKNINYA